MRGRRISLRNREFTNIDMKLKKGDMVKVIAGSSRGKTGKVLSVLAQQGKITVEGVNMRIKHSKPRRQGQKGQKIEFPAALSISNVMLVCSKCGAPTRIAMSTKEGGLTAQTGKKQRVCKKCAQMID